jgi:hypothetical protein
VKKQKPPTTEQTAFTKGKVIAVLWEIAGHGPEDTQGNLGGQIRACRLMLSLEYEPALKRLSELANIDPARTKGNRRGQESAAKLLKRFVSSMKVDKSGIQ